MVVVFAVLEPRVMVVSVQPGETHPPPGDPGGPARSGAASARLASDKAQGCQEREVVEPLPRQFSSFRWSLHIF